MTTTAVTMESARGLGGSRAKRMAAALVVFVSVFLYAVAATGNAHAADGPVSAPVPEATGDPGASAGAGGADEQALTSLAPPAASSAPTNQTASTGQAANAAAAAMQQAPRNIVVSIRINSPGNDGPISQSNVNGALAGSSNNSATGQGGAGAGESAQPGGNQDASTNQSADSSANADQNGAQNIVVSIRVNSPGDNGAVTQQNINVAVSSSGNVSVTTQGAGTAGAAADPDKDPATGDHLAPGTGRRGEAPGASPSGAAGNQRGSLSPMAHVSGSAGTGGGTPASGNGKSDRAAASSGSGSASQPAAAGSTRPAAGPSDPAFTPVRAVRHAAVKAKASLHTLSAGAVRAAHPLRATPRYAADVLGRLASQRPALQASDSSGPDISNAVLLTLIAVLGAFAVLFSSSLMGRASRVLERRTWRLR
jgi:hypothetical protein